MKTLIIILLLIPAVSIAQSKKELRAEISKYLTLSASLESDLRVQTAVSDSLQIRTIRLEEENAMLKKSVINYDKQISAYTEEVSRLEEQLDICFESQKPATSTKTNVPSTKNDTKPEVNPFATKGKGGIGKGGFGNDNQPFGGGNGDGKGTGEGSGDGKGTGPGGTSSRILIARPNVESISSEEDCKIAFSVVVNENGEIIGTPQVVLSGTTTRNEALIKQVVPLVKSEAKYNVVKGAANTTITLVIRIRAN